MKKKILTLALALSLLVALVIPASAALAQTGTTGVSGTLATTYTITPPATIDFGLISAAGPYTSIDYPVTASTNDGLITSVDIGVADASANAGFLTLGANSFATALTAKGGDIVAYAAVSGTDIMLESLEPLAGPGSYTLIDFSVEQTIVAGDLVLPAGAYSTTLTFTATFN